MMMTKEGGKENYTIKINDVITTVAGVSDACT